MAEFACNSGDLTIHYRAATLECHAADTAGHNIALWDGSDLGAVS